MSGRRSFIKKSAFTIAGSLLAGVNADGRGQRFLKIKNVSDEDAFWKEVRKQFPLTHARTYFNNGTIGPSPYPVLEAVRLKMEELNALGEYKGQEDSRKPLADFINVPFHEISLTHNTTEGINIIAAGLPLKRGDEVIMTSHEHAGNALPWLNQKKLKGFKIRIFTPADTADESLNLINDLITDRTRVIAVPHITCTTGHLLPVRQIADLAHDKGIWVFYDGAHAAGSIALDLKKIGCDFYASCGHKWLLGPSGTGFLYVREEMFDIVQTEFIGAYSDTGWEISEERQTLSGYVPDAHRYDYGTQSAALSNGLKAAVAFMNDIGMPLVESYSRGMATLLRNNLANLDGDLEILTPEEEISRSTMVTFRLPDMHYRDFGELASENKFRIRLVPESKLNAIRISTHIYNNKDEIDRFTSLVAKVIRR